MTTRIEELTLKDQPVILPCPPASKVKDKEGNLESVLEALKSLVTPVSNSLNCEDAFRTCVLKAVRALGFEDVENIGHLEGNHHKGTSETWNLVVVAFHILREIRKLLSENELSVSQQKDVRSCLQFIVSLGLHPSLLPGVGVLVSSKSSILPNPDIDKGNVSIMDKYERLCIVVDSLLQLFDNGVLRHIIVSNILEDVLAALCQLSYAPLKKPLKEEFVNRNFVMTPDLWKKLQGDQTNYREKLQKLIQESHQPTIFAKLMILQAGQDQHKPPLWMTRKCSALLTNCLVQSGGVLSLIQALFDSTPDVGADWEKVETLGKLITSPSNHYDSIAAQIMKLLQLSGDGSSRILPVIVSSIKHLLIKDPANCKNLIIDPLLEPMLTCCSYNCSNTAGKVVMREESLCSSLDLVFKCFSCSRNESSLNSLPCTLLIPVVAFLFKLYCKVRGSASHLFSKVEDLLFHILSNCDPSKLKNTIRCLLFRESVPEIADFPQSLCFNFGASGGVQVEVVATNSEEQPHVAVEEAGDHLILLLENQDASCKVSLPIFVALIDIMVDIGLYPCKTGTGKMRLETAEDSFASLIHSSQKQLGIMRLLAVLIEKEKIQRELSIDPTSVLTFLQKLLELAPQMLYEASSESEDDGLHCVFVSLMIVSAILDKCHEGTNWLAFMKLLDLIAVVRDQSKNAELSRLASGIYNTIATHGAAHSNKMRKKEMETKKSRCEEALYDSCDPLVPVRGHALIELAKLLKQHDSETLMKKEMVYCVLKENLKNEDSFIYLAAVNGMVAMAAIHPEKAVETLTEEFIECTTVGDSSGKSPELRMKVGEVLVQLTRSLCELAPQFKNKLLNAFLIGCKDEDHLMRASSLSNLGEVCRILGFRVGPILHEILMCVQSILKYDKAVEPRRASALVVTLLLQGLEDDALNVLHDVVLELYRTLKTLYFDDSDDVLRLHAQLALEELGKTTRKFLFPENKLKKKIQLL